MLDPILSVGGNVTKQLLLVEVVYLLPQKNVHNQSSIKNIHY